MRNLLSSRFQEFELNEQEMELATAVSPYTFAFIQNKVAAYANAVIEHQFESKGDPHAVIEHVIKHERLKAQVEVLEELMRELTAPQEAAPSQTAN